MSPRDEIEQVFFQICARAGDGVDFVLTDHFGEGNAELRGAHRPRERDHHFTAAIQVRDVGIGGIFNNRGIEMTVMPIDKFGDWSRFFAVSVRGFSCPLLLHGKIYNAIFAE